MQFVNHTPFPALAFGGVEQQEQPFHVVVLRQTLTWDEAGQLHFADEQAPLCEADEFFTENLQGSLRQESDLCQYKPRCDVIVNATAHAPVLRNGKTATRFEVRLAVKRPDTAAPLPPPPQGLNPFMPADTADMARWRAAVALAKQNPIAGERLIDKRLSVTGAGWFKRRNALLRATSLLLRVVTLNGLRLSTWKLTAPQPVSTVPLRLERAFGGQSRVESTDPAAARVPNKHRLTVEQQASHPSAAAPPVGHAAFAANPAGTGYTTDWYLKATAVTQVAAPQLAYPDRPITLADFNRARAGKLQPDARLVAGLGVRPKGHPARASRVGTVDAAFAEGEAALPRDFDFAVWNAAWPDQQVDDLRGDEAIELHNLCSPATPAAVRDAQGNTLLRLTLPGHLPFVLVRFGNGAIGELAARLDTLLIEPAQRRISLVWRATLAPQPAVRVLEARMISRSQRDVLQGQGQGQDESPSAAVQPERTHG